MATRLCHVSTDVAAVAVAVSVPCAPFLLDALAVLLDISSVTYVDVPPLSPINTIAPGFTLPGRLNHTAIVSGMVDSGELSTSRY